jgi:hypothetical protein
LKNIFLKRVRNFEKDLVILEKGQFLKQEIFEVFCKEKVLKKVGTLSKV